MFILLHIEVSVHEIHRADFVFTKDDTFPRTATRESLPKCSYIFK